MENQERFLKCMKKSLLYSDCLSSLSQVGGKSHSGAYITCHTYLAISSALAPAPARATAMARAISAAAAGSAAIALAKFSFRAAAISSAEAPEAAWDRRDILEENVNVSYLKYFG